MADKDGKTGADVWRDPEAVPRIDRPRLTFDLDVDVCVIGGGLAGLTVAREVARHGWSVVVLEASKIAWNASGHNCGLVAPGFAQRIDRIVERVGLEHARLLWQLSHHGVDYIRRTIRDTRMPGVHPVSGWLNVSRIDQGDDLLALDALLGQEFGVRVEGWPVEKVRDHLKSDSYFHGLYFPNAFHIHAGNYATGLAAAAEAAGARLFEATSALSIDVTGIRKRIATPQALVRSAHVVLCGNAHLGAVAPELAATVQSATSYIAVTAPLGRDRLQAALNYEGSVSDGESVDYHYRIADGDRLLWSGGMTTIPGDAARWGRRLKAAIERTYPQLGDVEIAATHAATAGFALHAMPQIGEVAPGLWLASAFGNHGINTTAMAGELIARGIIERDTTWRQFLPYNLVWAGGAMGSAVTKAVYVSTKARDAFKARMSRRREAVERETAATRNAAP